MLADCRDICANHPWVQEVWLLGGAAAWGEPAEEADLLLVCDKPPRSVAPGQRKRFVGELQTCSDRRLDIRLTTGDQLAKWLSQGGRFAVSFRKHAVRLYP